MIRIQIIDSLKERLLNKVDDGPGNAVLNRNADEDPYSRRVRSFQLLHPEMLL